MGVPPPPREISVFYTVLPLLAARTGQKIPKWSRTWSYNTELLFKLVSWGRSQNKGIFWLLPTHSSYVLMLFPHLPKKRALLLLHPSRGILRKGHVWSWEREKAERSFLANPGLGPPPPEGPGPPSRLSRPHLWLVRNAGTHSGGQQESKLCHPFTLLKFLPFLFCVRVQQNQLFLFPLVITQSPKDLRLPLASLLCSWVSIMLAERVQRQGLLRPPPSNSCLQRTRFGLIVNSCLVAFLILN